MAFLRLCFEYMESPGRSDEDCRGIFGLLYCQSELRNRRLHFTAVIGGLFHRTAAVFLR